jgi:hypothetical protein
MLTKAEYVKRFGNRGLNISANSPGKFSTDPDRKLGNWGDVIKKRSVRAG